MDKLLAQNIIMYGNHYPHIIEIIQNCIMYGTYAKEHKEKYKPTIDLLNTSLYVIHCLPEDNVKASCVVVSTYTIEDKKEIMRVHEATYNFDSDYPKQKLFKELHTVCMHLVNSAYRLHKETRTLR